MRTQAPAKPIPTRGPAPLSAEDRAILESLDLLEQLDLLETWDPDDALPIPEEPESDAR